MAGAPAYRYDNFDYAEVQPRPQRRPDISVIPGRGPAIQVDPRVFVALRVLLAMVLILCVAGAIRVHFMSAAVEASVTY